MQVVIGSMVAEITDLNVGDKFYGTHGFGDDGHVHDHQHYEVVGILKHSNSVIDKLILTDMKSVWEVHNPKDHHSWLIMIKITIRNINVLMKIIMMIFICQMNL